MLHILRISCGFLLFLRLSAIKEQFVCSSFLQISTADFTPF